MSFLENILMYLPSFKISNIFEICLIIFLVYRLIGSLKNTRAVIVLKGIFIMFAFYIIADLLSFDAIVVMFERSISLLIFALIVVFQPEMRKFLEQMGTKNIANQVNIFKLFTKEHPKLKYYSDKSITELSRACFSMGEVKTGALIVIERDIPLTEYIDTGIGVNADITSQLLINIFEKNTPLHDGAVVQIKDKIVAATCYLPLSSNPKISKHMGTRHRAAIGVSEVTDCIVIVVSEETGNVSMAINGRIQYNLTKEKFVELLYKYQIKEDTELVKNKTENPKSLKDKIHTFISKSTFNDKVVSCIVGIFGWVILMNAANPVVSVVIKDVPIEYVNTSVLESTGKTYEVISETTVDVEVKDKFSIVNNLKKEDISVYADFSKLSYVNAVPLQGMVLTSPETDVKILGDNSITVQLDSIISKEIPLILKPIIRENSSTFVPKLECDYKTVIVTGGKSLIDTVDRAICEFDVSDVVGTYTNEGIPKIYDKNGEIIDDSRIDINLESVSVVGISYPIKEIPIEVELKNEYFGDLKVRNVVCTPETVKIAGDAKRLENLSVYRVETDIGSMGLDRSKIANNQYIKTIQLKDFLIDDVYLVDESFETSITIEFEPLATKEIEFTKDKISFVGLNSNYNVVLKDNTFKITVTGEEEILNKLNSETIKPFIDVSTLSLGEYNLVMQFDGLDSVTLTSNILVSLRIVEK